METEERTDVLMVLLHGASGTNVAIENTDDYFNSSAYEGNLDSEKPVVRERTKEN